jgi:twitching motility protein PilT
MAAPHQVPPAVEVDEAVESISPAPALREVRREPEVNKLFRMVMKHEGSDLHLKVGLPPMMRLKGSITKMNIPPLTQEQMEKLLFPTLDARQRKILEDTGGVDYAYIIGQDECRFRVNLFKQRGKLSLVARRVNTKIPTFENLYLPPSIEKLCHFDQGMIILAGVTGSGKSTTIASMLDYINEREHLHILTIEDPIEYTFVDKKSVVNQREVGLDVVNWAIALKHAVREDPDIILVGEMRDRDTFEAGINAAETGHLVFGTIHANTAPSTIGRILDLFPADMHSAIRQALAFNLKAIVAQKLLPSIMPGVQRVPTNEIMILNPTIRELIIKAEDKKLPDAIRIGFLEGMLDFNESLHRLVEDGRIDKATALEVSPNPEQLKMALKGIKVATPGIL